MAGWASGWEELRVTWATGNAWEFHLSPGPPSSHGAKCCPGKTRRERPAEHGFLHPRPFVTTLRGGQSVLAQEHEGFGGGLLLQPSLNAAPASPCCSAVSLSCTQILGKMLSWKWKRRTVWSQMAAQPNPQFMGGPLSWSQIRGGDNRPSGRDVGLFAAGGGVSCPLLIHPQGQADWVFWVSLEGRDPKVCEEQGRGKQWSRWDSHCQGASNQSEVCLCLAAQSCLTLCDPMDCGPPASSIHGISQARILEWVAISFSRGSS